MVVDFAAAGSRGWTPPTGFEAAGKYLKRVGYRGFTNLGSHERNLGRNHTVRLQKLNHWRKFAKYYPEPTDTSYWGCIFGRDFWVAAFSFRSASPGLLFLGVLLVSLVSLSLIVGVEAALLF
ncbi:hypothetical protein [Mobiluncus porci]|uniref:Uncharacterized protein n=1 Tax=Mobiluncus porci TaxID=2652278 RepID=A0A7K0K0R0_9ACTO|nr:hypothetical protein [Mobiluncus porci]MST49077.1 hypothetical protein [Mobiluncus porci]